MPENAVVSFLGPNVKMGDRVMDVASEGFSYGLSSCPNQIAVESCLWAPVRQMVVGV